MILEKENEEKEAPNKDQIEEETNSCLNNNENEDRSQFQSYFFGMDLD